MDLSKIPHLDERRKVLAAFDRYDEISGRGSELTKPLYAQIAAIRREIYDRADAETKERTAALEAQIDAIQSKAHAKHETNDFPDSEVWRLHDDYSGVERCALTDLPLRYDDDVIETDNGDVLESVFNTVTEEAKRSLGIAE